MKKSARLLTALVLTMALMLSLSATAFAADSTVSFDGKGAGFKFAPGSEFSATDLFDNFKNVMPGDVRTEEITITNKAKDCDYIRVYMRAVPHGAENPMQLKVSEKETLESMQKFLAQLSMKVWNGDKLIFEASANELGGLKENVRLADLRYKETAALKVELLVPAEMGNEFAGRVGEVDWVFTCEGLDDPKTPPLIQTGQLKWPIPVMAGIGLLLITLGLVVILKNRKKNDRV